MSSLDSNVDHGLIEGEAEANIEFAGAEAKYAEALARAHRNSSSSNVRESSVGPVEDEDVDNEEEEDSEEIVDDSDEAESLAETEVAKHDSLEESMRPEQPSTTDPEKRAAHGLTVSSAVSSQLCITEVLKPSSGDIQSATDVWDIMSDHS